MNLITDHLDTWTSAIKKKSSAGRGGGKKQEFYGIKKLRELILELAVRGLLVPQDPKDEPASELLKNIAKDQARLIKEGKLKKQKRLTLDPEECPHDLPSAWQWVRFGEIALHNAGKTLDRGRNSGEPRKYITTSNLYWGRFELSDVRQMLIRAEELEKCSATKGDLLICEGGEAGRAAVWTEERDICFQNHIHRARLFGGINAFFAYRLFEKLSMSGEIENYRKGVGISNMSGKALASITFPLPPLAEQHRIVAKVDELMALCDQLEQQQEDSVRTHGTLVQTLLGALTAASERGQFEQAWQRIASHFDTLFTTESSIAQLQQTILQLAVMGKLVEQEIDPLPLVSLGEILSEPSFNGISKGPTTDTTATEVLRISAGTSGDDFFVDESDFKYVDLAPKDIESATLRAGDLLACRYNGNLHFVGRFSLYRAASGRTQVNPDKLIRFRVDPAEYSPRYVCFAMNAASTREAIEAMCATTAGNIGLSAGKIKTVTIPIPPLAEQHRIVAKVDELMTLCDRLKASLQTAQATRLHLADSLVEAAIN